ncbi:MAG: hypothetical protein HN704_10740 [Bacteroidetes bacterium]|jgi:gliding motility-associated lipoprotein GldB|nr:hypothetical protein [Bacteroidota bacterium]MBT6688065.1 hypothetical protein [Bacteroidota bacterium]MBT7145017.1 hypothetical protein [Bacteroidota bacterium]MBT7492069.1 hypothetical protein [Bacteroidota bacterium]
MKKFSLLILTAISIFCLSSCYQNIFDVDISDIDIDISIKRFDKDLFDIPVDSVMGKINFFENKYQDFFDLYNYEIIRIGGTNNSEFEERIKLFLTNETVSSSYIKSKDIFTDLAPIENDFTEAFKYYKYYFPNKEIPQIISFVSGFNHQVAIDSCLIGIGLDKYLGRNCELYAQLGLPRYMTNNMHPGKIATDCLLAWARSEFAFNDSITTLLSFMVYEGKLLYFLDAMFPNQTDNLKIGYSAEKLNWCKTNEENMWTFLIEQKLLYSHKKEDINRFIKDGPFTAAFMKESPARTGIYLGWQIVRNYMKNNPDKSLQDLMNENNYQNILSLSKYKP